MKTINLIFFRIKLKENIVIFEVVNNEISTFALNFFLAFYSDFLNFILSLTQQIPS